MYRTEFGLEAQHIWRSTGMKMLSWRQLAKSPYSGQGSHRPKGRTSLTSLLGPVISEKVAQPALKVPPAKAKAETPSTALPPVTEAAEIGPAMQPSMQEGSAEPGS